MMNIAGKFIATRSNVVVSLTKNPIISSKVYSTASSTDSDNASVQQDIKIDIPKRIARGPTDILRALASTVGRDPTAGHYKYHDDPFLMPMSNVGKRSFAMAQEAGRKAAQWIRREHSDLFQHRDCEPPVEAFFPPMVYTAQSDVHEGDLRRLIGMAQVSDARLVYQLLRERGGGDVSEDTLQALLELFCFQNGEDTLSPDFIEERWFKQSMKARERQRKTWKDGDMAEEIFISMKTPTAAAYAALIQGMCRYFQAERAWQLYEESQTKGLLLNTNTYNSLIGMAMFIKEDYDMRWTLITDLLGQMHASKLRPNLGTLNSVLYMLSTMSGGGGRNATRQTILKVLAEFKRLGIEPSLASWYYVLISFCKERGPVSTILNDIMNEIENKEHEIRDLKDTNFFVTAMDICRYHLNDIALAKRVHTLLHYGNNYNLIGDSYKESIYFRHYFVLFCTSLPFPDFMNDYYLKIVPHIYIPEPGVMAELLNQLELHGAVEFIPKLWSDMVIFDHCYRENLLEMVLNLMVNNGAPQIHTELSADGGGGGAGVAATTTSSSSSSLSLLDLNEKFANVAWDLFEKIENQNPNKANQIKLTGDTLGKVMILQLRNKNIEKSCLIMDKLSKEHQTIVGVPKFEALSLFVDCCIDEKMPSRAIDCIQYCSDCGFPEAHTLAIKLHDKLNLDENYLNRLQDIVGDISSSLSSSCVASNQ